MAEVSFTIFIIRSKALISVGLFSIILAMSSSMASGGADWLIASVCKGVMFVMMLVWNRESVPCSVMYC